MGTWKGRPKLDHTGQLIDRCTIVTKRKKKKNLSKFFNHCVRRHWISANPAREMPVISQKHHASPIPKIPFDRNQMCAILDAAIKYRNYDRAILAHAMSRVMRHAGLAIADTTKLERSNLQDDDRLFLYRTKTGEAVYVLLPPELANDLRALRIHRGRYFFWNGKGKWESASNGWGKVFRVIFKQSGVQLKDRNGNPLTPSSHFFRNTFAKEMLEAGLSIERVATLMGDKPETVREYYAKWVPDLQNQLDDAVRASWALNNGHKRGAKRSR
jgi:site-specific recombinase XerD